MHHINKKPKTLELPQKLRPNTVYNIPCSLGISAFSWYETNAIDILTAFVLFEITIIFKLKTEIHEICKKKKKVTNCGNCNLIVVGFISVYF